jgi:AraC-like DNA-binding protein
MAMPDQPSPASAVCPSSTSRPRLAPTPGDGDAGAAADAPMTAGPMLTAAQAIQVLGVTARDLTGLIAAGWLRPHGHDAHCYPILQIEALLNSPSRTPGTARDPRPGLLHALGQCMTACAGPGVGCQLHWNGQHPHLLIRAASGAQLTVGLVPTSAGSRFLWDQWRSHPAADLLGAATAITATLGLRAGHQPATSPDGPHGQQAQPAGSGRRGGHLEDAQVITGYTGGLTVAQCAGEFGTTPRTVLNILRRHGVPTRTRGKPVNLGLAAEHALVAAYRDHGLPMKACADWFAISPSTVARILRQHGVAAQRATRRRDLDPAQVITIAQQPKAASGAGGRTQALTPASEQAMIAAYRDQGLTMEQCANQFGVSCATVARTLRRHGVPARPRGGCHGPGPARDTGPAARMAGHPQPTGPSTAEPATAPVRRHT